VSSCFSNSTVPEPPAQAVEISSTQELAITKSFRLRAGRQASGRDRPPASSRSTPGQAGGQADLKSALTALAAAAGLVDKRQISQVGDNLQHRNPLFRTNLPSRFAGFTWTAVHECDI